MSSSSSSQSGPMAETERLKLLSWNIAMCQPSHSAPHHWHVSSASGGGTAQSNYGHNTSLVQQILSNIDGPASVDATTSTSITESERRIRYEILRHRPDAIALQECPSSSWATTTLCEPTQSYISVGTTPSHCGYVDLLVRRDLLAQRINLPSSQPSVAATVQLVNSTRVAISSSHLEPFKEGASTRLQQLQSLARSMTSAGNIGYVMLGDMNMRKTEEKAVERIGSSGNGSGKNGGGRKQSTATDGLVDAWKAAGSDRSTMYTWNSFINRYHDGGFEFNCRFDRTYLHGTSLGVVDFGLVGDAAIPFEHGGGGPNHFLSDHYGMLVTMDVAACSSWGGNGQREPLQSTQNPPSKKQKVIDLTI